MLPEERHDLRHRQCRRFGLIKYLDICVREQLASGELVRVLQPWCQPFAGFYFYTPTHAPGRGPGRFLEKPT